MSEDEKNNLKLIAKNEEDLNVISAYIQNSIMIVNRFMWEDIEKGINRESKRMRCSLKFEEVLKVKEKKIKQKNKNKLLECLAIECGKILSKNNQIIFFVGGGIITLISESIEAIMRDLGEPWDVRHVPKHKI